MNPAQLLSHFDRISNAPDAVPRLRRFILDLAVRGELLEQDPRDEPASELLKRIQTEKARLVHAGEIKKDKPLSAIEEDEILFAIPANWQWVRLNDITSYIQRGKSPKYAAGVGLPVISQKCVQWGGLELESAKLITCESIEEYEPIRFLRRGDLLWNSTGTGTIGRIIKVTEPPPKLVCDSHVTVVRCLEVDVEYVRSWLRSDHVYAVIEDRAAGSTNQVELTSQLAMNQVLPLPPLPEQQRIVAKVDELMALCDRLEAAQAEREGRRDRLVASSLNRLNNGADHDAFRDHARFYFNHLPRFTMRPEHIQQLRQTILSLAVRGRLTPILNWPEKPEPLREFATLQNGYAFKSEWFVRDGIRLLRNANVGHGVIRWDDIVCLPADRCSEFKRFQLDEGDVVLSLDRPFIVTGTKVARVRPEDLPSLLLQRVGRFQPKLEQLCPDYLFLWLHSPHFTSQIDPGRSNGVPHISSKQVESAEIFVPSLTEQHRIVAKIEELMALCDWLETQLTTTHTESRRLLEAVLHEALAPAV